MNALALLNLFLLTGPVLRADPPTVVPPNTADSLTEALPILQAKYPDFQALNYKPGDKLEELIARSNGEINLNAPETVSASIPIITATLPDNIIYWRLASFTPAKSWLDLGAQLEQAGGNAAGIILDLRSNTGSEDIAGAAQVITYFVPGDDSLLKFLSLMSDGHKFGGSVILDHPFQGPIIVLINHQTTGAAEILAARLKADGALVVGRATAGNGAVFKEYKFSSGQVLRYVAAHVHLADGTDLWDHPVTPDIGLTVDDHAEKAALTLIKDNHILDVIGESPERHRMSEATLVQGQDPEWDEYLASLEGKPVLLSLPIIHDVVLISALDSLKAIRFSRRPAPPAQATANASLPASSSVQ
jgi:hypothetical protein